MSEEKGCVEIVYATNEGYLPMLGVSLYSLVRRTSETRQYRITILEEDISAAGKARILALQRPNVRIRFVDVAPWMERYRIPTVNHLSKETAYRLVVDRIFPGTEKLLYIDVDTIVCHDVAELFDVEIGEAVLGVARARIVKNMLGFIHELKIPVADYFNAGILLINVPVFREKQLGVRALELLEQHPYPCQDQDVLNILCHGEVCFLDSKWNVEWQHLAFPEFGVYVDDVRRGTLEDIYHPYILHYASSRKPWNHPEYPLADRWWAEARSAGFAQKAAAMVRNQMSSRGGQTSSDGLFSHGISFARENESIFMAAGLSDERMSGSWRLRSMRKCVASLTERQRMSSVSMRALSVITNGKRRRNGTARRLSSP